MVLYLARLGIAIEQDFLKYLQRNPHLLVENPEEADYHYLPIFEIAERLSSRQDVLLGEFAPDPSRYLRWFLGRTFVQNILSSYISISPRGTCANSFRFYESMQLGVVPCSIGDIDVRPFKSAIDWDSCSFFFDSVDDLEKLLDHFDEEKMREMGRNAYLLWRDRLRYQKWCSLALEEMERFIKSNSNNLLN